MDARQDELANPFGMDEDCQLCPELCESRTQVVHGYGDVGADFVVLGSSPSAGADAAGVPFTGDDRLVIESLSRVGLVADPAAEEPDVDNVYLSYVTRCRHPDREATDEEVSNCEAYRSSELRMINPEIIVPVGGVALEALAFEYTTESAEDLDVGEMHATTVRGRGFELVPMKEPADQSDADTEAFVEHFADLLGTDYRQTKGRQGSLESGRGPDEE
ncbi:uracil-DNA glycosylase [Halobacteriales archaeon QH_10_67_22]|nr:MAG: uracil-DNA glycosylase [Halobacteriales archaeon QH_10_67_22]